MDVMLSGIGRRGARSRSWRCAFACVSSPGRSGRVAFTTLVADSRDEARNVADRYRDLRAADRALSLSWTDGTGGASQPRRPARGRGAVPGARGRAHLSERGAARVWRSARAGNRRGQRALWAQGISGDWPIVLATISDAVGTAQRATVARRAQVLAHEGRHGRSRRSSSTRLHRTRRICTIRSSRSVRSLERGRRHRPARRRVRSPGRLDARRGLGAAPRHCSRDRRLRRRRARQHHRSRPLSASARARRGMEPDGARSSRGASRNGGPKPGGQRCQAADAEDRATTRTGELCERDRPRQRGWRIRDADRGHSLPPAPWANVIANPNAGFCITERGGGFTWAENSYFFRLTPWHNDPVSDPCGEVLYLRDDESGYVWTPTPAPAPATDAPIAGGGAPPPYLVRHAAGRTTFTHERDRIATELSLGVPEADPVKIAILKLTNRDSTTRRLIAHELRGADTWRAARAHAASAAHVARRTHGRACSPKISSRDDFASRVAFSWVSEPVAAFTRESRGVHRPQRRSRVAGGADRETRCRARLAPGSTPAPRSAVVAHDRSRARRAKSSSCSARRRARTKRARSSGAMRMSQTPQAAVDSGGSCVGTRGCRRLAHARHRPSSTRW